jgi:hypothetical protein
MLELLKQYNCRKALSDNARINGLWADAARWRRDLMFELLCQTWCRSLDWAYSPVRSAASFRRSWPPSAPRPASPL